VFKVADKTDQTDPQETESQQEPDQEAFWTRFQQETAKVVDARLAERDKKRIESAGKQRRNDKRSTLPGIVADIFFGKEDAK
jgi:uncharacterized protein YqjF (DUF2071 family)